MVRRSQEYRQIERIPLLLSRRWHKNKAQNYAIRYNDLVQDRLCSLQRNGVKFKGEGRICNQMLDLGLQRFKFLRVGRILIKVCDGKIEDLSR